MKPPDGIDDAHPRIRRTSVPWYRLLHSLRFRLIAASILVSGIMALLLVANSVGTMRTALREQAAAWVQSTAPLLNATLAAPLAKRDHATLEAILREIQSSRAFTYAVLRDQSGAVVAGAGWNPQRPLPDLDTGFEAIDGDGRFDTAIAITKDGEHLGALQIGLDASFLATAERHLVSEGTVIVVASFVLATVLLGVIGWFLTRHLRRLTRAGEAMARGDLSVRVDVRARDEVGQLATAFNAMARAVEDRVSQIRASEAKFHAIADYSYDCELWLAPDGRLLWINQRVLALTGFSVDECMAMPDFPVGIVAAHDAGRIRNELQQAATGTSGSDVAFRIRRRDGTAFWAAADWRPIYDHAGEHIGIRLSIRDVSQRKEAENRLSDTLQELEKAYAIQKEYLALASEERARLNALLATMHFGILFVDRDNKIIYSNPAFEQIWLLTSSQMRFAGLNATSVLHHAAHMLADPDSVMDRLMRLPSAVEPSEALELEMADGRLVTQTCHPVRDARQQLVGHLWVYEDVTRERQTASQLLYLAERDALTGLYNRHRFQEELTRMVSEGNRLHSRVALLFFDVDEFKHVNDTFGHRAGDAILVRVAGEVSAQVRRNEIFARLGGDEFAILAPEVSEPEASTFAERIVQAIARIPFTYEGHTLRLTCSLGVAIYPLHASNAEDLVTHADLAMYQAKEAGKNTWRMYREDQGAVQAVISRLSWNDRIQRALDERGLRLHFQGIFDCRTGALSHLEALVRMVDPDAPERLISPSVFIPVAEKSGRILDVDRWVIAEAIRVLATHPAIPPIAVNISGRSFNEPQLPHHIAACLRAADVAPERFMVELTETSAVSDLHDAQRFIGALRALGCRVCLDDFGAGFSSFSYLKHIHADVLKIDGQFIRNLPYDRDNQVFVKAIVDVARGLKRISVAEYVEDEATLAMLKALGVDCAQGYYLEHPVELHPAIVRPGEMAAPQGRTGRVDA